MPDHSLYRQNRDTTMIKDIARKWLPVVLVLLACADMAQAKTRKTLFVIVDGIPADCLERLQPPTISEIAKKGRYARAYAGGETGTYSETPTISAIGYANILTGTWMNKHNVRGNENIEENYNYPTIFQLAKMQQREVKTAIYSSWTDNRTVLLGEGKAETGHLRIDHVYDGYDLDKQRFPDKEGDLHIQEIDAQVCKDAARCIAQEAPDLNWIYLWYTDDAFHFYGNGQRSDKSVMRADRDLGQVWEAVKQREQRNGEEWLVIVTTDHGRTDCGHDHGGQSERERTVWMATNQKKLNSRFGSTSLSQVDIVPTICRFMGFDIPQDNAFELDGQTFYGNCDIYGLQARQHDDSVVLTWKCDNRKAKATVYATGTNNRKQGQPDKWLEMGTTETGNGGFCVKMDDVDKESRFFKFVVKTDNGTLNKWVYKR